jgi:plasmid replication initiation protein
LPVLIYHNDLNKIPAQPLNDKELNLLFALIYKFRQEQKSTITINFSELKLLSNGLPHNERFLFTVENTYKKLMSTKQKILLPNGDLVLFNIFNEFIISTKRKEITIEFNKRFKYLIDDLSHSYTKFELADFTALRSLYSKNMFRLLKQFEKTKTFIITLEKFKEFFSIPDSYTMSKINDKVLAIIKRDLEPLFKNLKITKLKKGRYIDKLKFTWTSYFRSNSFSCSCHMNTQKVSITPKNKKLDCEISEFESIKQKLYPKLIKFISDLPKFQKLNDILKKISTQEDLNNFKLKYGI